MPDDRPPARDHARPWTRAEDYLLALTQLHAARKRHPLRQRTEPEEPRFMLSTLPFLVMIGALFVICAAVMILAWPGNRTEPAQRVVEKEQGVAQRGWMDEAQREFHR